MALNLAQLCQCPFRRQITFGQLQPLAHHAVNNQGQETNQRMGANPLGQAVVDRRNLAKIVKVDLKSDLFSYTVDEAALKQAELMDGKLLLVTNVADLTPPEVVQRYKALADIERGFRVLKSEIADLGFCQIAPVYHRLPERIRAHALVCFLALIVYRVMRQRLKLAKSDLSPERALAELRKIQRHRVRINKAEPISGISTINDSQADVLQALNIRKPTQDAQLSLL